jgi:ATP-binding cassette subfamily F protein uup
VLHLILLSAEKITKSYSEKKLLKDMSLFINEGDKIGVIGTNGTGKSTFLKIIAEIETPDAGTVTMASGVRISYLPQNPIFGEHLTVLEQVFLGASSEDQDLMEYEAKSILTRLGITDFSMDVSFLSGGEKKRVAIARALVKPSEILILDEPTNHLDNEMVLWLENYLRKYSGAIVMITHDRYFLDRVTNRMIEISRGNLYSYPANYTKYLELKAQREEMEISTERKTSSLYKTELEWISRGARARGTKSKERIERFKQLSERERPTAGEKLNLSSVASRLGKKTIEMNHIAKSYTGKMLIRDFDHIILRDARIGIVGKNGCGKSTLLKMIMGLVEPDSGTIVTGETVRIGYFSQESEEMDPSQRVIAYIRGIAENIETVDGTVTATQMLERFLFPADLQWNTIAKLSGGERRRLYLLSVLMKAPNILLLDEPSNDLDIETLTILEDYLENFNGAVVVVSHDRYFLDKVVDRIFEFQEDGTLRQYVGGYSDYQEQITDKGREEKDSSKRNSPSSGSSTSNTIITSSNIGISDQFNCSDPQGETAEPRKKLKFTYKEEQEYRKIEEEIAQLEANLRTLDETISRETSNYAKLQELLSEKEALECAIAGKMERWIYLNDLAEKIAAAKL